MERLQQYSQLGSSQQQSQQHHPHPHNNHNHHNFNELDDEPPHDHDVDFIIHPTNKLRWNHIEDLDSFFTRIYYYHQKHGFVCILLKECFELIQFIFVIIFATFLLQCVHYPILFKDKIVNIQDPLQKVTIGDALIECGECISHFGPFIWFTLIIALLFWIIRFIFVCYNTISNLEIRAFYKSALQIQDVELDNLTWYDVQKKLREVQRNEQMCIHKSDLTELDIYHRILRFKNYMIAMINKSLLPLRFHVPFIGEIVFLTHGGPWAPFETSYHLREDYKKVSKRKELADGLAKRILWIGLANLALSPAIFLWQILYSFFNYAEVVKREPGTLGMRRWSLYGRLYTRHFNELEHEINARLSRAYRPAAKYMSIFNSPVLTVIAQNIAFVAGAILAVLSVLAIYDEDVLSVEHVLLLISVSGAIIAVCRAFIPDEQLVWCPERLLTGVLAHVHYFPDQWKGQAHTSHTRDQFALLFQYKAVYLLEELLSPFITPIIFCFHLRPKALAIVDFYRNFTVEVIGVGDVCSFAQMDIRRHGNPTWSNSIYDLDTGGGGGGGADQYPNNNNNAYSQAENGKTELSLVHFTHTNPEWKPPTHSSSGAFITNLKERAMKDASNLPTVFEENPFYTSLNSISSMGNEYSNIITSLSRENNLFHPTTMMMVDSQQQQQQQQNQQNINYITSTPQLQLQQQQISYKGYLNRHEGPIYKSGGSGTAGINKGIVAGTQQQQQQQLLNAPTTTCNVNQLPSSTCYNNSISFAQSFALPRHLSSADYSSNGSGVSGSGGSNSGNNTLELNSIEMSLDALYIHEIHHLEMKRRQNQQQSYIPPPPPPPQPQPPSNLQHGDGGNQQQLLPTSVYQTSHDIHQQHDQPQIHYLPTTSLNRNHVVVDGGGTSCEKTPLLHTAKYLQM